MISFKSSDSLIVAPENRPCWTTNDLLSLTLVHTSEAAFKNSKRALFEVCHIGGVVGFKDGDIPLTIALRGSWEDRLIAG